MSLRVCPSCADEFDEDVERCPRDGALTVELEPTRLTSMQDFQPGETSSVPAKAPRGASAPGVIALGPGDEVDQTAQSAERTSIVDPLVGQQVGEYVVVGPLGEGGMGVVYEARHPLIGKRVAIKCLKREVAANPEEAARLLAEARAANSIGHRGIIDIFGFGTLPDGRQYFAMEYLVGEALNDRIARGPMEIAQALALMDEILAPLGAAHGAGVIHRDLKPSNIFLVAQPDGTSFVKILDFGLAKLAPLARGMTPQTNVARILGTPEFMAPEQARGEPVSPRTDLYAFGVIAYEFLTGRPPFEAPTVWEVVGKHLNQPPPSPSEFRASIPVDLEKLVLRLMAKAPGDRPENAEVVRAEVKRLRKALHVESTHLSLPAVGELRATERQAAHVPVPTAAEPAKAAPRRNVSTSRGPASVGGVARVIHAPAPTATPAERRPSWSLPRIVLLLGVLLALGAAALWAWVSPRRVEPLAVADDPGTPEQPTLPIPTKLPIQKEVQAAAPEVLPFVPPALTVVVPSTPEVPAVVPVVQSATPVPQVPVKAPPRPAHLPVAPARDLLLRRLARVEKTWARERLSRPVEDRAFDAMLVALRTQASKGAGDTGALNKGIDEFVDAALNGKEPR